MLRGLNTYRLFILIDLRSLCNSVTGFFFSLVCFAANHTCPTDQFKCSSNRCIPKRWLCDGTNDCDNNEDEANATCTGMCITILRCSLMTMRDCKIV